MRTFGIILLVFAGLNLLVVLVVFLQTIYREEYAV